MASAQTLSDVERRAVAAWAADCAERVLPLFEVEAPDDDRPRDAIARARAYANGELDAAGEIRRRFVAGRAAHSASTPAAVAAARAAAQASGVAHMGAHALGAAAYAATAASLARADEPGALRPDAREHPDAHEKPDAFEDEIRWQLDHLPPAARAALATLPPLGRDSAGPLGAGLLAKGTLATVIRRIQSEVGTA